MQTKTKTTTPAPKPDAQPVQAATHRLYCGHKAEGTPGKIPYRNFTGLYCYDCDAWVATMPSTLPPFHQGPRGPQGPPAQAATHTPGPWAAILSSGDESWMVAAEMPVARIPNYDDRAAANARLIAAAPALLAALESMVSTALKVEDKAWASAIDRAGQTRPCDAARAALDAAKGGAQ